MKKIISYSLFGTNPRYRAGAVMNIIEANRFFPGWTCRIYTDINDAIIPTLRYLKAEIIQSPQPANAKFFWRFKAVDDADICLIRDIDSIINERDHAAVLEWIQSGSQWHIMRDHPAHRGVPVMAGMWGYRKEPTNKDRRVIDFSDKDITTRVLEWSAKTKTNLMASQADQRFLKHFYETEMKHSSIHRHGLQGRPFPSHPPMQYAIHVGSRDFRNNGYWKSWQDRGLS